MIVGILPGAIVFTASGSGAAALIERWGTPGTVLATGALVLIIAFGIFRLRPARVPVEPAP